MRISFDQLTKIFQYDNKSPLDITVLGTVEDKGTALESIEFAGARGERCEAAIIKPPVAGQLPAVVWLGSSDKDWQPYATEFSKMGAISLALDYCGDASIYDARAFYDHQVENVINIRRAVDLLTSRPDVDRSRIAYVGHSEGAMLGADALAVDKRFKAAVLEGGLQGFTYHICSSEHPYAIDIRKHLDGQLPEYVTTLAPLDAILYIGHAAPTSLLFQSGRTDKGVPQSDAQAFFNAASEPKKIRWYDAGHEMTAPPISKDRDDFLKHQLGM